MPRHKDNFNADIDELTSICRVRNGERCKDCVMKADCEIFCNKFNGYLPKDFTYVAIGGKRVLVLDHNQLDA